MTITHALFCLDYLLYKSHHGSKEGIRKSFSADSIAYLKEVNRSRWLSDSVDYREERGLSESREHAMRRLVPTVAKTKQQDGDDDVRPATNPLPPAAVMPRQPVFDALSEPGLM